MRINNNVAAFNANRSLQSSNMSLGKSLEKLSSGFRINRAGDDAAGLTISQGLRAQASGLQQATRNAQDGISVVQTAEGAMTEIHSMLNRMRDLAVQSANTGSSDANAIGASQAEYDALSQEITRIAESTKFGSKALLDGSYGADFTSAAGTAMDFSAGAASAESAVITVDSNGDGTANLAVNVDVQSGDSAEVVVDKFNASLKEYGLSMSASFGASGTNFAITGSTAFTATTATSVGLSGAGVAGTNGAQFQVGANSADTIKISIGGLDATTLGVGAQTLGGGATGVAAIDALDQAIGDVSTERSKLGALQNRFESTINNLQVSSENIIASESRIRDTDMATEMTNFTKQQILQQAGTAMLGQANSLPQGVLRLLG